MTTTILALDLGKFNSVFCWYEPISRSTTFRTVKTTPEDLRKELTRQPVLVVEKLDRNEAGNTVQLVRTGDEVRHALRGRVDDDVGQLAELAVATADRPSQLESHPGSSLVVASPDGAWILGRPLAQMG